MPSILKKPAKAPPGAMATSMTLSVSPKPFLSPRQSGLLNPKVTALAIA